MDTAKGFKIFILGIISIFFISLSIVLTIDLLNKLNSTDNNTDTDNITEVYNQDNNNSDIYTEF